MPVSVVFLRAVMSVAEQMGASRRLSVAAARTLADITDLVSDLEAEMFLHALLKDRLRPGLGLVVGELCSEASFHLVGQVWAACPSLRDAIAFTAEMGTEMLGNSGVRFVEDASAAQIIIESSDNSEAARFGAEVYAALMAKIAIRYAGGDVSQVVSARFAANQRPMTFSATRGIPTSFGRSDNTIVVTRELMDRLTPGADPRVLALIRQLAYDELVAPRHLTSWSERVRRQLRQETGLAQVGADYLARKLMTTQRSLRRRLVIEGTTLTEVVSAECTARATAQLAMSTLSIRDIADTFGYSDVSAFHRAFKRWTGMTPKECRNRLELSPLSGLASAPGTFDEVQSPA